MWIYLTTAFGVAHYEQKNSHTHTHSMKVLYAIVDARAKWSLRYEQVGISKFFVGWNFFLSFFILLFCLKYLNWCFFWQMTILHDIIHGKLGFNICNGSNRFLCKWILHRCAKNLMKLTRIFVSKILNWKKETEKLLNFIYFEFKVSIPTATKNIARSYINITANIYRSIVLIT